MLFAPQKCGVGKASLCECGEQGSIPTNNLVRECDLVYG